MYHKDCGAGTFADSKEVTIILVGGILRCLQSHFEDNIFILPLCLSALQYTFCYVFITFNLNPGNSTNSEKSTQFNRLTQSEQALPINSGVFERGENNE